MLNVEPERNGDVALWFKQLTAAFHNQVVSSVCLMCFIDHEHLPSNLAAVTKFVARHVAALVIVSLSTLPVAGVEGYLPNQAYGPTNLFKQISPQLSDKHYNQPSAFNGYVIFAGNGVHDVWD